MITLCNNLVWAGAASVLCVLIWRSRVRWTVSVTAWTGAAALSFITLAGAAPYLPQNPDWMDMARYLLPAMVWGAWMMVTILVWPIRESVAAHFTQDRLRCRTCGYSLRGLYTTRCPECGDQLTLDELFSRVTAGSNM